MNVKELITELEKVQDKELDVMFDTLYQNHWVSEVEEIPTGTSGYEKFGCVVLGSTE